MIIDFYNKINQIEDESEIYANCGEKRAVHTARIYSSRALWVLEGYKDPKYKKSNLPLCSKYL